MAKPQRAPACRAAAPLAAAEASGARRHGAGVGAHGSRAGAPTPRRRQAQAEAPAVADVVRRARLRPRFRAGGFRSAARRRRCAVRPRAGPGRRPSRPNAYVPDDIGIPKPHGRAAPPAPAPPRPTPRAALAGAMAPFKPSATGRAVAYARPKPQPTRSEGTPGHSRTETERRAGAESVERGGNGARWGGAAVVPVTPFSIVHCRPSAVPLAQRARRARS